ncbi:MAG: GTPase [Chloroflexota bacterium]|nr:GTPase [Chloroflexota bacterium]
MPANLTPAYHEAERVYRAAKTLPERVEALERMLSVMPKHKGTDQLRAELRTKIARLLGEEEQGQGAGARTSFRLTREGVGLVSLVGLPNAGKSQLLVQLTGASARVAPYPFTTRQPTPGMMPFENVQIQLVDLPAINDRAAVPGLYNILRGSDLLLLVVDLGGDVIFQMESLIEELAGLHLRPWGFSSMDGEGTPKKALVVANKVDLVLPGKEGLARLVEVYGGRFPVLPVSALRGTGLEDLKARIFDALDIIRVYTKGPGQKADLTHPVTLKKGSTIEDVAAEIHKEILAKLKYAQVWGSTKFDGQKVPREYQPADGDVVELHA